MENVNHAVNKANGILRLLKHTFKSRDPLLWNNMYVSWKRPHLENAVQALNQNLIGDIKKLEFVQKRTLNIPEGF